MSWRFYSPAILRTFSFPPEAALVLTPTSADIMLSLRVYANRCGPLLSLAQHLVTKCASFSTLPTHYLKSLWSDCGSWVFPLDWAATSTSRACATIAMAGSASSVTIRLLVAVELFFRNPFEADFAAVSISSYSAALLRSSFSSAAGLWMHWLTLVDASQKSFQAVPFCKESQTNCPKGFSKKVFLPTREFFYVLLNVHVLLELTLDPQIRYSQPRFAVQNGSLF